MHMLLFHSWFLFEYAYPIKISTPRPCKKFQQWNLWSFERFMDCICKWLVLFFDCALDKACLHDKMDEIWTRFSPRHCESFDVTFGQSDYNHRFCLGILLKWRCGCFRWKYAGNMLKMPSLPHTTLHCSNRSIIIYANEFVPSFAECLPLFSKELLRLNGKWKSGNEMATNASRWKSSHACIGCTANSCRAGVNKPNDW